MMSKRWKSGTDQAFQCLRNSAGQTRYIEETKVLALGISKSLLLGETSFASPIITCLPEENIQATLDDFCAPENAEAIVCKEKIEYVVKQILEAEGTEKSWQPIEIAPRDGRHVLLFYSAWAVTILIGFWEESGGWKICGGMNPWKGPTHWMPLPEAPKED